MARNVSSLFLDGLISGPCLALRIWKDEGLEKAFLFLSPSAFAIASDHSTGIEWRCLYAVYG